VNIGELIAQLQKYPVEACVVTPHFERGYDEIVSVMEQSIAPSSWIGSGGGAYLGPDTLHDMAIAGTEMAVILDWTKS